MVTIIEDNMARLIELCQQYKVARLDVFGSAASGKFDPASSDLDFLVEILI
jgi:predicted nucleotidyltransferase